jgi:hypothetical protein
VGYRGKVEEQEEARRLRAQNLTLAARPSNESAP